MSLVVMFAQMVSQVRLSSTVFSDVAKFRPYHIVARLIFVELWYQCWKTLLLGHFDRVIGNEDSTVCEFLFVQRCEGGTNAAEWWAEETAAAARKFQVSVNTVDSFWVWAITITIKTRVDGRIYKVWFLYKVLSLVLMLLFLCAYWFIPVYWGYGTACGIYFGQFCQ